MPDAVTTLWTCVATCPECGRELNRAEYVPEEDKGMVALSSPLMAICEVRSHNTLSDLNYRAVLTWTREETAAKEA